MRVFATDRPDHAFDLLRSHFDLPGKATLTLNTNAAEMGTIQINTITINKDTFGLADPEAPYPWSGTYFHSIPVTLIAHPEPGYIFDRWEEFPEATSNTLTLDLEGDTQVTARFRLAPEPGYTYSDWRESVFPDPLEHNDPEIAGPYAVSAPGGLQNLFRYALGIDSAEDLQNLWDFLPRIVTTNGAFALKMAWPGDRSDVFFRVEEIYPQHTAPVILFDSRNEPPELDAFEDESFSMGIVDPSPAALYRVIVIPQEDL